MQLFNGFLLYFLIWWVVWFMVLPLKGFSLKTKAFLTFVIAFFCWAGISALLSKSFKVLQEENEQELNLMLDLKKEGDS